MVQGYVNFHLTLLIGKGLGFDVQLQFFVHLFFQDGVL